MSRWVLAFALMLAACGGPLKYKIASSAKAPGSDAEIVADVNKDMHITKVNVKAVNLAPPARVTAGATMYVVWQRKSPAATWARIGILQYDESNREGKLETSVPEVEFDLLVSPEKDDSVGAPSGDGIFAQHVGKPPA